MKTQAARAKGGMQKTRSELTCEVVPMKIVGYLKAIALAAALATTATGASAFHPQGPDCIACNNQGRQGIDVAIAAGGMVHCDVVDDDGGDGGTIE
jgi:hypothetical protein